MNKYAYILERVLASISVKVFIRCTGTYVDRRKWSQGLIPSFIGMILLTSRSRPYHKDEKMKKKQKKRRINSGVKKFGNLHVYSFTLRIPKYIISIGILQNLIDHGVE